jgi:hypothetical protein
MRPGAQSTLIQDSLLAKPLIPLQAAAIVLNQLVLRRVRLALPLGPVGLADHAMNAPLVSASNPEFLLPPPASD